MALALGLNMYSNLRCQLVGILALLALFLWIIGIVVNMVRPSQGRCIFARYAVWAREVIVELVSRMLCLPRLVIQGEWRHSLGCRYCEG